MKEFWNKRYSTTEYVYGVEPNAFLKQSLSKYKIAGKMLFPADGEGRNSVFAASLGIETTAFDISEAGMSKALALAKSQNVSVKYLVGELSEHDFQNESFDAMALIFAHFPPSILDDYHQQLIKFVKKDGLVILEGFSKNHLKYNTQNPKVGGPRKIEMLFSIEQIKETFNDFEILYLEEEEVELKEGAYHIGKGAVVRFIGRKK